MKFAKKFSNFEEGIKELSKVSFSAEQALTWQTGRLPSTEEETVKNLALNVAFDRPTANGVDWDCCKIKVSAFGTEYKTAEDLRSGGRSFSALPRWTHSTENTSSSLNTQMEKRLPNQHSGSPLLNTDGRKSPM